MYPTSANWKCDGREHWVHWRRNGGSTSWQPILTNFGDIELTGAAALCSNALLKEFQGIPGSNCSTRYPLFFRRHTSGSRKRPAAEARGIVHIFDARTLEYAQVILMKIMKQTNEVKAVKVKCIAICSETLSLEVLSRS